MKTNTLKAAAALGLSALLAGSAAAQESQSKPVGYETITIPNGFSYAGLRLVEAAVGSGEVAAVGDSSVTLPVGIVDGLDSDTVYLFEVTSGSASGAIVEVSSFDLATNTLTLSDDLSADLAASDSFELRPASSLASVFGADNSAGLDAGQGGPGGADQIFIPDGSGGFDRYYYDDFNAETFDATWSNVSNGGPVDPDSIPIIYTDGIVILGDGTANNSFVVSGSVKLDPANLVLQSGFNYLGTVFPAGSTLESIFGLTNSAGLNAGNGGPGGADIVFVPNESGFDRFYYDSFNAVSFAETWSDATDNSPVTAGDISFDDVSSIIILHEGAASSVTAQPPSFYSEL